MPLILDQQGKVWRATFTSSPIGLPRVEAYHPEYRRAFEIGQACERVVRKKFPDDFPREEQTMGDVVKDAVLGMIAVSFMLANVATGAAAFARIL